MDYAQQQRNPGRHVMGVTAVVLLHVLIVYALVTGLARTVVEVIKGPIEVKVIEEVVKKPPPPPEFVPPPPKMAAPPPPFIPPPEVNVAPPPAPAPTISAVSPVAPPAPQAPVIQRAPEGPAVRTASSTCSNYREVLSSMAYPREAQREGLEGEVVIEFVVTAAGQIKDVAIVSSSNRVFNRPSMAAVSQLSCQGQGRDVRVSIPIGFKLR